tara:strand:+ start:2539 stop:2781 length:243 start_codon:yes stop_codon:yes gene_type:complete
MALEIIGLGAFIFGIFKLKDFLDDVEDQENERFWEEYANTYGVERAVRDRRIEEGKIINFQQRFQRDYPRLPGDGILIHY